MIEQEDRLAEVVDSLPDGVVSIDERGTVSWMNRAAADLLPALRPGAQITEALRDRAGRDEIDRLVNDHERIELRATPGSPPVAILAAPRIDSPGRLVLSIRDLSERDEMDRLRNAFVVSASHELRTPLTSLLGFAELLDMEGDDLTPERAEAARIIHKNARYVSSLVMDLLDLSRGTFGQLTISPEPTSVPDLIEEVTLSMRTQIDAREQRLEIGLEPGLPRIEVDRGRIKQVLFNFIDNAHLYSPPGATIRLHASRRGEGVEVRVCDDGPGVAFEDPQEVFGSFARGRSEGAQSVPGAGIGLTISKQLVELHRGEIWVESEPGAGATFGVWLPIDRRPGLGDGDGPEEGAG